MVMPLTELEAYYRKQRAISFHNGEPIRGIVWRKRTHGLLHVLLTVNRVFSGLKLTVIDGRRPRTNKPLIYACTHVGRYDIEMAIQLIHTSAHLLMGDPGSVYKNFDGAALWLNGVIFVDTAYKEDRYVGKESCIKLLEQGGSLLIFPEGAWKIKENQIVMPLFTGTAEIAIRVGAEIVPIAIERYDKHYYANIGENISPDGYTPEQKQELTDLLRDTLCALKWDIWTQFPSVSRANISPNAAQQFVDNIMRETENGYTVEEIIRTRFHTKKVTTEEAFDYLANLQINRSNAFLLNKKFQ